MNNPSFDFGYSWPWTYGHLVPLAVFGAIALLAWRFKLKRWILIGSLAIAVWAAAGFAIVREVFRINRPTAMPTASFLPAGSGRVLDVGAGSGRSSLMVLLAKPQAKVTALDNFSADYIYDSGPAKLHANAQAAGVDARLEVVTADMRQMPMESGTFDAALSAYAVDHLNSQGIAQSMKEIARVLRPGGQFLLMTINRDRWILFAYPFFLHGHTYYGRTAEVERWRKRFEDAGLEVTETGEIPTTLYMLGRKR